MKRNGKKNGFTIVELVIVIAVIAILAGVLIPTFSSLVAKANMSADQQAVTNMNKILAISDKPTDVDGVIELLIENDYAGDLTTYYKNYSLAWIESENVIVLIEGGKVVYPERYANSTLTVALIKPMATDSTTLTGNLAAGQTVYLGENVTANDYICTPSTGEYKMNLVGNTLKANQRIGAWLEGGGSKLVITNGIIDSTDSTDTVAVRAEGGNTVEVNNVQIYSKHGVNPLMSYGGTMVLNNVTAAQSGSAEESWFDSAIQVVNQLKQETGKAHTWTICQQANVTVNSGMYSGKIAIQIDAPGGNITINGGTFKGSTYVIQADFAPTNYNDGENFESVITINGGTFEGAIKITAATTLVINGGTFTVNPTAWLGAGKTAVTNADGTWTVK